MNEQSELFYPLEPDKRRRWNKIHLTKIGKLIIGMNTTYFLSRRKINKILQNDPDVGDAYFELKQDQLTHIFLLIEKRDLLDHPSLVLREGDFELQKRTVRESRTIRNKKTVYRLVNREDGEYEGKGELDRLEAEDIQSIKRLVMDEIKSLY